MDCMQIKEKLVQYIEGLLSDEEKAVIDNHLTECGDCNKELSAMMEIHERLILSNRQNQSADLEIQVFNRIICEQNNRIKKTFKPNPWLENWRSIMKSRITRLSAATAMVFAVIISMGVIYKSEPVATAQDVLSEAVKAASGLNSIHMKGYARTSTGGSFEQINLDGDFTSIEIWKKVDKSGIIQCRIEKPGAYFVTDGKTSTTFNYPRAAYKDDNPVSFVSINNSESWIIRLLDVQGLLDNELQQAKNNPDQQVHLFHEKIENEDKIVLEVDVTTNVSADDYFRNRLISVSDSLREYQFNAHTKLLEGLKVYVIDNGNEILVFEITGIEYNAQIDDSIFVANLPDDVIWLDKEPKVSSDDNKYSQMTPKEAAAAFFEAGSKGDWDVFNKFFPASRLDQWMKDYVLDLEVIYIGEPIESEAYPGFFLVPYKIKTKDGEIHENKLGLSKNYKTTKRYIIVGGF